MDNYVSNIWTAISAIATALMAIATFVTIYYNGKRWRKEDKRREYDEPLFDKDNQCRTANCIQYTVEDKFRFR